MNTTTILNIVVIILLVVVVLLVLYGIRLNQLFYKLTTRNIRNSVQVKFLDLSPNAQELVALAIEVWRIDKRLQKAKDNLTDDQNKAFTNSISKLRRYLEKNDITITDYTDQKYNEGMNLDVLSIEKDSKITESRVKDTHEPAVLHKGQLIKKAKVVLLEK